MCELLEDRGCILSDGHFEVYLLGNTKAREDPQDRFVI